MRSGYAAAQTDAKVEGGSPHRRRAGAHRPGHCRRQCRPPDHRDAARKRSGRGRGRGRPQARSRADRARAVRRNLRAGERMLPPAGGNAARRRARQRRALRGHAGKARRHRARRAASKAGWSCWPKPDIALGDCRIEWADGGVNRDSAAADAAIGDAVARYVSRPQQFRRHTERMPGGAKNERRWQGPAARSGKRRTRRPTTPLAAEAEGPTARGAADLEAVFDVPVQVSAVLGRARMEVGDLLKLGPGTVLELDRKVGEAIDIYVNNRLVARGEVVLVEEKLGVTMTEIIKAERLSRCWAAQGHRGRISMRLLIVGTLEGQLTTRDQDRDGQGRHRHPRRRHRPGARRAARRPRRRPADGRCRPRHPRRW